MSEKDTLTHQASPSIPNNSLMVDVFSIFSSVSLIFVDNSFRFFFSVALYFLNMRFDWLCIFASISFLAIFSLASCSAMFSLINPFRAFLSTYFESFPIINAGSPVALTFMSVILNFSSKLIAFHVKFMFPYTTIIFVLLAGISVSFSFPLFSTNLSEMPPSLCSLVVNNSRYSRSSL